MREFKDCDGGRGPRCRLAAGFTYLRGQVFGRLEQKIGADGLLQGIEFPPDVGRRLLNLGGFRHILGDPDDGRGMLASPFIHALPQSFQRLVRPAGFARSLVSELVIDDILGDLALEQTVQLDLDTLGAVA
jgi:hypothetical protein